MNTHVVYCTYDLSLRAKSRINDYWWKYGFELKTARQ